MKALIDNQNVVAFSLYIIEFLCALISICILNRILHVSAGPSKIMKKFNLLINFIAIVINTYQSISDLEHPTIVKISICSVPVIIWPILALGEFTTCEMSNIAFERLEKSLTTITTFVICLNTSRLFINRVFNLTFSLNMLQIMVGYLSIFDLLPKHIIAFVIPTIIPGIVLFITEHST